MKLYRQGFIHNNMVDHVTTDKRSIIMSHIGSKGTKPELSVRKLVHSMGYRFRLHLKQLPGCPDLVFTKRKKIIFVNGCFWHGHDDCKKAKTPKSNVDFWTKKIEINKSRDELNYAKLRSLGWELLIIWQCQLVEKESIFNKIVKFLGPRG